MALPAQRWLGQDAGPRPLGSPTVRWVPGPARPAPPALPTTTKPSSSRALRTG